MKLGNKVTGNKAPEISLSTFVVQVFVKAAHESHLLISFI